MNRSDVFASRLKKVRTGKKVSQEELGSVCKNRDGDPLSRAAVAQWEASANPTRPTFENLIEAAKHLNASIDYLVGLRDVNLPLNISAEALKIALSWDQMSQAARDSAKSAMYWADKVESRPTPTIEMLLEKFTKHHKNKEKPE